jgi:ribonuclease G
MAKELVVSVNGREKKIAIIENEKVTEFYIERGEENQGIVGNIYKGRVMRVLPGMQSAFVDIGLERDAFLYVSDFFDEEEEFERIVIDKSKKGEEDAQRMAAEEIAQARVEREHQIDAAHERVEPLLDSDDVGMPMVAEPEAAASSETDGGKRRGRRGRRRGRTKDEPDASDAIGSKRRDVEDINTPFVAGDPSIQRVVDEEETAANGEMFKDARLQERIFDQIHAVEFNFEDDFRTAEVGSVLPSSGFDADAFQRVDDSDLAGEIEEQAYRRASPIEAHVEGFVDDVEAVLKSSSDFQRVSDEEEVAAASTRRSRKAADSPEATTKKRTRKTPTKTSPKKSATKRTSKKRATSKTSDEGGEEYADSEARVSGGRSREEFATRRGGRRRRRPSKQAPTSPTASVDGNGKDEEAINENGGSEVAQPLALAPVAEPRSSSAQGPRDRRHEGRGRGFSRRDRHQPAITDLLREGQEILVQIAKEPIAKKGARITSHIALPGRFLVYMPTVEHVGVSRKIESDNERVRLRKLIQQLRAEEDVPSGGFIVRTAGVGIAERELREDVRYLVRTWLDIRAAAEKSKPATLVHRDLDLVQRILRDQLSDDFAAIRVDSEEEYESIVEFVNRIQPRMVSRVKLYTREEPILEKYGVQAEIDKAIKPRVWLKSGGYLVINQTEALVAIDVNTGKFVGRGSGRLEDTITRTNLEAVDEIVRQIRLRDLGGIIVLDLIDMEERRNRTRVMQALQDALRSDKSPTKVLSFNDFGLVIMTRKRVKQSLERTLCAPCQYCQGAGLIKSAQTVCYELLEEARRLAKIAADGAGKQATLRIHPEVARALRSSERDVLNEIEAYLGSVDINSDAMIHQEQFDFAFI